MVRCPTEVELERWLADALEDERAADLREHVAGCETCGAWIREAGEDDGLFDTLGRLLRGAEDLDAPPRSMADGRYRILGKLGEGGMGVVWEAEQRSPRRSVALKVIRPGHMGPAALERFQLEAELLGRMGHEGIARVLEAGSFEVGEESRPFLAMELVRGRPFDRFVEETAPPLGTVLELVARVCDAVDHAHRRGVLHRDLKPSNVLVTDAGEPRVLDFGVARLSASVEAQATTRTLDLLAASDGRDEIVGTLPFMAPEALDSFFGAADTRADVYALGAMLYLACAGRLPIDVLGVSLPEAARRVTEVDPVPLGRLDRACAGDIETIAAKALEKDPARRYASAAALAEDLRHVLAHEPITARPPSAVYVLARLARRHRAATVFALVAVAALLAGTGATAWSAVRARRAERVALEESARLASINDFLRGLLGAADPLESGLGDGATVRQVLDDASRRLDRDAELVPAVELELCLSLAAAYQGLGELGQAGALLDRAEGVAAEHAPSGEVRARLLSQRAALAYHERDYARAAEGFAATLEAWERAGLGADPRALATRTYRGAALLGAGRLDAAAAALEGSLERARRHGAEQVAAGALVFLARVRAAEGDLEAARSSVEAALDAFRSSSAENAALAAHAWTHRAILDDAVGDHAGAAEASLRALEIAEFRYGVDDPATADELTNLGTALMVDGRAEEALVYHQRAIALVRDARKLSQTASCLVKLDRWPEARELFAEAYDLVRDLEVLDRGAAAAAMGWASAAGREGDREAVDEAYALIAERMPPAEHPRWSVWCRYEVGRALERAGEREAAANFYRDALDVPAAREADPLHYARARVALGEWVAGHDRDEAAELLEALVDDETVEPELSGRAAAALGWAQLESGEAAAAADVWSLAVDSLGQRVAANHPALLAARRDLACALFDLGRAEEAREHFEAVAAAFGGDLAMGLDGARREAVVTRSDVSSGRASGLR